MQRYRAWLKADRKTWAVFDTFLYDWCSLPDAEGNPIPLEWRSEPAAEAWLYNCYKKWATWESQRKPVPNRWRPVPPPGPSPFPVSMPMTRERTLEP